MKKNGFVAILAILIVTVLGVIGFFKYKGINFQAPSTFSQNFPTELSSVPVYPNVTYDPKYGKTEFYTSRFCGEGILCKVSSYSFKTNDDPLKIEAWYKKTGNGWKYTTIFLSKEVLEGNLQSLTMKLESYIVSVNFSNTNLDKTVTNDFSLIKPGETFQWPVTNQVEIRGWKSFVSKDGSLAFAYPKEVFVKEDCESCGGFIVSIKPNINNLTSKEYAAKVPGNSDGVIVKNKPQYFSNLDFTIIDGIHGAGSPGPNVYIVRKGKIISIETDGVGVELLNMILSTFKFMEE